LRFRIALLALTVAVLAIAGPAAAAPTHKAALPVKIRVVANEFTFTFPKASVPHGSTVLFNVVNKGAVAHNLVITSLGKATPLIQPGKSATVKVIFKKKGRFPYICSVPRHAEQGMAGSFLVK